MLLKIDLLNSELCFYLWNDKDLDGRVIVLRKVDQQNSLIHHSDIRSSKIEKIKKIQTVQYYFMEKKKKYS